MNGLYDRLGLHVYALGEGIKLDAVHSELRYEDGTMRLAVEGSLDNTTEKEQKTPDLAAVAVGPDGGIVQRWQIDAPVMLLKPRQTARFQSLIVAPSEGVTSVMLNFVEPRHADD